MTAPPDQHVPLHQQRLTDPPPPAPSSATVAWIARDAANRATSILNGNPADTDPVIDTIRLLHGATDPTYLRTFLEHSTMNGSDIKRLRTAYAYGGAPGVRVMLDDTDVDTAIMTGAVDAITDAHTTAVTRLSIKRNRITNTSANVDIRYGVDGCWHPFTNSNTGNGMPASGASPDPVAAHAAALSAKHNRRA